jgi:RNase_H superfamily
LSKIWEDAVMTRKYLAFDIETAKNVPGDDFNWRSHRPLGISCAAALRCDVDEPILWHGKRGDGTPAERMSHAEAKDLVRELAALTTDGYTLLTWNGLGFDFDVLAEESGCRDECKELALDHVDMMFHVFCDRGFPVGLEKAAQALGIPGKPEGMSGLLAPQLWAQARHREVLDYVAQDVRISLQIARVCEQRRRFQWKTQRGMTSSMDLPQGWLTVREAMRLPLPDTSWMDRPIPRHTFTNWVTGKNG